MRLELFAGAQVLLACKILDGAQFRPGVGAPMTVEPAKFEMHGDEYKPKKRAANKRQKKLAALAEEKALGWGGFDDKLKPTEVSAAADFCPLGGHQSAHG